MMSRYDRYLQEKTAYLCERLSEIQSDHLCTQIMPTPFGNGFRNRAKFKIFSQSTAPVFLGTDPLQGEVEAHDMLWILPDWGREIVTKSFEIIARKYSMFPVDGLEIQLMHGKQNAHLTLSVNKKYKHTYTDLAQKLLTGVPALCGLAIPSQKQEFGSSDLIHTLLGEEYRAHYSSFFQSNLNLTPELLQAAKAMVSIREFSGICDLYCGVGLFSLLLGTEHIPILGIDSHSQAIKNAKTNAQHRSFAQAEFIQADVSRYFPEAESYPEGLLILDPPRSGCPSHVLERASRSQADSVLLVSCCLETQVRDISLLKQKGLEVVSLKAFDMFPFTDFLETAVLLQKK